MLTRMTRGALLIAIVLGALAVSGGTTPSGSSVLPAVHSALAEEEGDDCSFGKLMLAPVDAGPDIFDLCLQNGMVRQDGSVTVDLTIRNRQAVWYNLVLDPTGPVTATLGGQALWPVLDRSARDLKTKTALFPLAGSSELTLPAVTLRPGASLAVRLKKFGEEEPQALALAGLDLASTMARMAGLPDGPGSVSGSPAAATAFASALQAGLSDAGFDSPAFSAALSEDPLAALDLLATAVQSAPGILAPLLGPAMPEEEIVAAARRAPQVLRTTEIVPYARDLLFSPEAGGYSLSLPGPPASPSPSPSPAAPARPGTPR